MKTRYVASTLVSLGVLMAATAPAHAGPERLAFIVLRWVGVLERGAASGARISAYELRAAGASRYSSQLGRSGARYFDEDLSLTPRSYDSELLGADAMRMDNSLARSMYNGLDNTDRFVARQARLRELLREIESDRIDFFGAEATSSSAPSFDPRKFSDLVRNVDEIGASIQPRLSADVSNAVAKEISAASRQSQPIATDAAAKDKKSITFNPFNGELKFSDMAKFETGALKFSLEGKTNVYLAGAVGVGAYYCHDKECIKKVALEGFDETFGLNKLTKVIVEGKPKSVVEAD